MAVDRLLGGADRGCFAGQDATDEVARAFEAPALDGRPLRRRTLAGASVAAQWRLLTRR
jgi:hypothetical protein